MLPDTETLYAALVAREDRFAGQVLVCVRKTKIYCRLGCPARTPLRRNVEFRRSVAECEAAGFRACKRCRPAGVTDGGSSLPSVALRETSGEDRPQGRDERPGQMRSPRAGRSSVTAS